MNNSNNIDWLDNPTITQILQMVIGFHDPDTDVFDEFGVDLDKARELIEAKLKEAEIDAERRIMGLVLRETNGEITIHHRSFQLQSDKDVIEVTDDIVKNGRTYRLKALKVSKADGEQK